MRAVFGFLVFVVCRSSDQIIPVDQRTVEFRTVHAYEFIFAADLASAAAAHTGTVDHVRGQGSNGVDAVFFRDLAGELHHHRWSDGDDFIEFFACLNQFFQLRGREPFFAVAAVIGHHIQLVNARAEFLFQNDQIFGLETGNHDGLYTVLVHAAGQRICKRITGTAADHADSLESVHMGRLAQRSYDIRKAVAHFQLIHQHGGSADCRVDQIDGAVLFIMSCHRQRDSFTEFICSEDDKLSRFRVFCDQRRIDLQPDHIVVQSSFPGNFKSFHGCSSSFPYLPKLS